MNKYKYLLKNIGLLTISNFGTKILSFILIPVYTNVLSTADYGTYDVYSTTVSLLMPILTFNIIEAVMRFALDDKKKKNEVFTIGIKQAIIAILIVICLIVFNNIFCIIRIFTIYPIYFSLLFASSLLYDLLIQFARGIEYITDVAVAGVINSIVMIGLNVWFLVFLKIGLDGYFLANIMACIIPCIYMGGRLSIWKYCKKDINTTLETEMYSYSKPLVFNTLAWWINNVSDRYIVTWLCGVSANGIYSIAYKIPSILNAFQSIFNQAWTISAVKEFNSDSGTFYSKVYKIYNCGMVTVCSILIVLDKLIAQILFSNDFYLAWKFAPFLMISVVFGALSGLLGGIFSATKMSKVYASTTLVGASVNTVLNIILVKLYGPVGASIATAVSYCLVWFSRYKSANRIVKLDINIKKDICAYNLLVIQSLILYIFDGWKLYCGEILGLIVIIIIYIKDIMFIIQKMLTIKLKV